MDKIIALFESSPQTFDIDEGAFLRYMKTTPMWDYFKISQAKYFSFNRQEKTELINDYYIGMQQVKLSQ